MKAIIQKIPLLKTLYITNPVFQFLISYVFVLIVPVCIMLIALQYTFSFVLSNIMASNLTVLNNSKQLVDMKIDSIQTIAGYMVCNEDLLALAKEEKINRADDRKLLKALDSLTDITDARSIDLLDSSYVVLRKPECVLYKRGLYSVETFTPYIMRYGLTFPYWYSRYLNYEKQLPCFSPIQSGFDYIVPFGVAKDGKNYGVVVCTISDDVLKQMLGFPEDYGAYSFFMMDDADTVLWSEDYLSCRELIPGTDFPHRQGIQSKKDRWIIYSRSEKYGWNYVLVVSSGQLLKRFNHLRLILIFLVMVAVAAGLFISSVMALRKGKPVNEIFDSYKDKYPDHASRDMSSLEKLFNDLVAARPGGLFYPELLEGLLCSNIKSANFDITKSIILMIEKENFENRPSDTSRFTALNGKICATLRSLDLITPEVSDCFSLLEYYAGNTADKNRYFAELSDCCKILCSNAGLKKSTQRKCLAEKIQQYLAENYMNPGLGLTMAAAEFSVSDSYVSMIYKEQMGVNFADYLEKLRIDHAVDILKAGSKSIKDVAAVVGYYSAPSFRRAFKRVTGKSPKEYR